MTGSEDFSSAIELVVAQLTGAGADQAGLDEVGSFIDMASSAGDNALALAGLVAAGEARLPEDEDDLVGVGAFLAAGAFARFLLTRAEETDAQ